MSKPSKRLLFPFLLLLTFLTATLLLARAAPLTNNKSQITNGNIPNLVPAAPPDWPAILIPAAITGTHTTEILYAGLGAPTYLDWGILNDSTLPISTTTTTCITLDSTPALTLTQDSPAYAANQLITYEDNPLVLPAPGTYTLTITADCTDAVAESDETDNTYSATFDWNPYINIILADEHGFDKCEIATTSQMNAWWGDSPYFFTNIYIGGMARTCPNTGLTNNWVRNVVERGWNLLPTWVGPQAPCSAFTNRFSANPGTAREQGRREADAAYQVAADLGLIPPGAQTILYYDLEAYPNQKLCREAAGQFLSGWSARLHELGQRSGIYGAGCSTYPVDWPTLPAPPDAAWLAHWIYSGYTPSATVWDVACVPNTLWPNHERIRQYAGGHDETYSGVTFNIDSNRADGPIVGINPSLSAELPKFESSDAQMDQSQNFGSLVQDFQLVAPSQGWIIQNGQFLWKNPDSSIWNDRTPPSVIPLAATFLNPNEGWLAAPTPADTAFALNILHTLDQGQTWQSTGALPLNTLDAPGQIWLDFLDAQTGWVAVQLVSSSNFSLGQLYRTTDGGQTWTQLPLPLGAPVSFVDAQIGWVAGGPNGDELYVTHDGGETWTALAPATVPAWYALPTFVNGIGILPATIPDETHPRVAFFTSHDQGQTWQPLTEIILPNLPTAPLPIAIVDPQTWLIADPATNLILTTSDTGKTLTYTSLPAAPTALQALTPTSVWTLTNAGACNGTKGTPDFFCRSQQVLLETMENGNSWQAITP